jgi:hypothetical protein
VTVDVERFAAIMRDTYTTNGHAHDVDLSLLETNPWHETSTDRDALIDPTVTLDEFIANKPATDTEPLIECEHGPVLPPFALGLVVGKTSDGKDHVRRRSGPARGCGRGLLRPHLPAAAPDPRHRERRTPRTVPREARAAPSTRTHSGRADPRLGRSAPLGRRPPHRRAAPRTDPRRNSRSSDRPDRLRQPHPIRRHR